MIEQQLKGLGLNQGEIKVYVALVNQKKALPSQLARQTGINRSTVYSISRGLVEKGLVSEDLAGSSKYLVAESVERLKGIFEKDKRLLEEKEKLIEAAIQELKGLAASTKYSVPKIRFIEEVNMIDHLYKQAPVWTQSLIATGTDGWGFLDHTFYLNYKDWFDWYWKVAPQEIKTYSYTNFSSSEEVRMQDGDGRRINRFWGKPTEFTASIWVMGEYLLMFVTKENPHYMVEINDAVLAHNMREYFKNTWRDRGSEKNTSSEVS